MRRSALQPSLLRVSDAESAAFPPLRQIFDAHPPPRATFPRTSRPPTIRFLLAFARTNSFLKILGASEPRRSALQHSLLRVSDAESAAFSPLRQIFDAHPPPRATFPRTSRPPTIRFLLAFARTNSLLNDSWSIRIALIRSTTLSLASFRR